MKLLKDLRAHIEQMSPHQKDNKGGELLIKSAAVLGAIYAAYCKFLAAYQQADTVEHSVEELDTEAAQRVREDVAEVKADAEKTLIDVFTVVEEGGSDADTETAIQADSAG